MDSSLAEPSEKDARRFNGVMTVDEFIAQFKLTNKQVETLCLLRAAGMLP